MKNKIVKNFIIFLVITIFFSSLALIFKNNMGIKRKNTIKTIDILGIQGYNTNHEMKGDMTK